METILYDHECLKIKIRIANAMQAYKFSNQG